MKHRHPKTGLGRVTQNLWWLPLDLLIVPVVWILQTKPDYRDLRSSGIPDLLAVLCVPYLWVWMTPEIWRSLRRQRAAESARRDQMWSLDQAA